MNIMLKFEEIHPFVRHTHMMDFTSIYSYGFYKNSFRAYDHRLFYVYKGEGTIQVENIRYNTSKGQLFLLQPGIRYCLNSSSKHFLELICINFDFTQNYTDKNFPIPPKKCVLFDESNILEYITFSDVEAFNRPIYLKNMHILENTLLEIIDEYNIRKKFFNQKITSLFLSVLNSIARATCSISINPDEKDNKASKIIRYIHDNYNKDITYESIGKLFNYHPNYINRLMMLNTGTSLHQYLIMHRISQAISLIQTTNMPISEIAYSVGFRDANHFSKQFKLKTGKTPGEFRKIQEGI